MNEKKQYLDENGVLFYTQKMKLVLDELLAAKADETEITELEGIIDSIEATLATKVDKVQGKGLSTNDLTDALVEKIQGSGWKATLDGIDLEGTLTKDGLGIASLLDLSSETSARQAADTALQTAIDAINNNKVVSLSASDYILPATEVAKIPTNGVCIITNTNHSGGNTTTDYFISVTVDFSGSKKLITFVESGIWESDYITSGSTLSLNATEYQIPSSSEYTDILNMLDDYAEGVIATSSDVAAVASDLSDLDADVYRKSEVYTKSQTDSAISTAIGSITQIRYEIVQSLPQVGENGVIYLVQYAQTPQGNVYQEWIWLPTSQTYETLGSTNQIDLTNYITFDDIEAISNLEITTIYNSVFGGGNSNSGNSGDSGNSQSGSNSGNDSGNTQQSSGDDSSSSGGVVDDSGGVNDGGDDSGSSTDDNSGGSDPGNDPGSNGANDDNSGGEAPGGNNENQEDNGNEITPDVLHIQIVDGNGDLVNCSFDGGLEFWDENANSLGTRQFTGVANGHTVNIPAGANTFDGDITLTDTGYAYSFGETFIDGLNPVVGANNTDYYITVLYDDIEAMNQTDEPEEEMDDTLTLRFYEQDPNEELLPEEEVIDIDSVDSFTYTAYDENDNQLYTHTDSDIENNGDFIADIRVGYKDQVSYMEIELNGMSVSDETYDFAETYTISNLSGEDFGDHIEYNVYVDLADVRSQNEE